MNVEPLAYWPRCVVLCMIQTKEVDAMLKNRKRYLYLNETEASVVLQSLVRLKNALTREGRYTDCVDELFMKIMEAPVKKI